MTRRELVLAMLAATVFTVTFGVAAIMLGLGHHSAMSEKMQHELLFNVELSMHGECFVFVVRTNHLEPGPIGMVAIENTGHQDQPCEDRP